MLLLMIMKESEARGKAGVVIRGRLMVGKGDIIELSIKETNTNLIVSLRYKDARIERIAVGEVLIWRIVDSDVFEDFLHQLNRQAVERHDG